MCPLLNFCSFPTSHNNRGDFKSYCTRLARAGWGCSESQLFLLISAELTTTDPNIATPFDRRIPPRRCCAEYAWDHAASGCSDRCSFINQPLLPGTCTSVWHDMPPTHG